MASASYPRTDSVELLSIREELLHVVRIATTVVLGVWLYLASALGEGDLTRRSLLPYQALIQNRPSAEQRMFRELQEGLLEAEGMRSRSAAWPTTVVLADEGIPPFAHDPTAKSHRWQLLRDGTFVSYLGIPDRFEAPAWLVLIQEPDAGVLPDQAFEDEEHHRLIDGTMLHVSTWTHADGGRVPATPVRVPQTEGWTQLYAVGPGRISNPSNP
jgi:hypothetical protein